jgi:hypothetical protein
MPSVIVCPACNNPLRLPDHLLGRRVRCPTCNHEFLATEPAPQPAAAATGPSPSMPSPSPQPEPPPTPPRADPFGFSLNLSLDDPGSAPTGSAGGGGSAFGATEETSGGRNGGPAPDVPVLHLPATGPVGKAVPIEDDARPSMPSQRVPPDPNRQPPPPPPEPIPFRDDRRDDRRNERPYDDRRDDRRDRDRYDDPRDRDRYDRRDHDDRDRLNRTPRRDLPAHRGGTVLTLGIVGLVLPMTVVLSCLAPIWMIFSICAWVMGQSDLKAMDGGRLDPEGRGNTQGGMVCGIIGTILNALFTLAIIFITCIVLAAGNSNTTSTAPTWGAPPPPPQKSTPPPTTTPTSPTGPKKGR